MNQAYTIKLQNIIRELHKAIIKKNIIYYLMKSIKKKSKNEYTHIKILVKIRIFFKQNVLVY